MNENEVSFAKACADFFGKKPGQKLQDFAQELRALTPEDREEMAPLLTATREDGKVVVYS